ncbi:galactose mutarotase [Ancylobacter sp. A5.8]|uniref:aldose epimerase family protein n=1 Tax=Ancylobacter gelatini TaxID=2919920 RepID=UPI001F4E34C4|nr:aldose epimerase family protein [Ancylobacter gelatini]MCJ8144399.1 galactose mutarotase [Ancylobacter gelatini]
MNEILSLAAGSPAPGEARQVGEADGVPINDIALAGPSGARARVLTFGAVLRDLEVPDAGGTLRRVVLGYDDLDSYLANLSSVGATCGRVANRIRAGHFSLDGQEHQLGLNERGVTHLHGGWRGFSRRAWEIGALDAASVTLTYRSGDGEEGYPGTLAASCTYSLIAPGTLRVVMEATTDAPTPVNLAHHSYFTLDPETSVRELEVEIAAASYTPVDELKIPTGEIAPVAGTAFDFRRPRRLDADPAAYDMNFVLDGTAGGAEPRFAARARSSVTGRTMEVWTTEPGLQMYDGQYLVTTAHGLGGLTHGPHAGICFEAQNFPDAVNQPGFPSPWLRPGETYRQVTEYRFG